MKHWFVASILFASVLGCNGRTFKNVGLGRDRTFTNIGNGVGIPAESIEDYARAHGVSRGEARVQMRAQSDERRITEHAKKYGLTMEQAMKQLKFSGEVQDDD